jgi:hypothetical protein
MYHKITGPDKQNTDITDAMIWVLPKSGNIFTSIFFKIYNMLLNGEVPTDEELLYSGASKPQQFNKRFFIVNHAEFPGLKEMEVDEQKLQQWQDLSYSNYLPWVRNGPKRKEIVTKIIGEDPEFLKHFRVVFIFRNPLDQLLSHYKHFNRAPPDDRVDASTEVPSISLEEFIFNKNALSSYIKMFYTFHLAIKKFPDHILCIPYEELITNKPDTLYRIIKHLDLPFDEEVFIKAMELTSMENLKQIEDKLDVSLIGEHKNKTRHIRNGGIGVWQTKMTPEIVQRIEAELNKFDLSLTMFHLADELEPQFSFLAASNITNSKLKFRSC